MSKVSVIAKLTCKDGTRADLIDGMGSMMEHVESEEGTLKYILLEDAGDANVVWLYEEYADDAAFKAHSSSDAMKAVGPAIGQYLGGAPELIFCSPVGGKGL